MTPSQCGPPRFLCPDVAVALLENSDLEDIAASSACRAELVPRMHLAKSAGARLAPSTPNRATQPIAQPLSNGSRAVSVGADVDVNVDMGTNVGVHEVADMSVPRGCKCCKNG